MEAAESHASSEHQRLGGRQTDRQTDRLPQALDNQGTNWAETALQALKIHRKIKKKLLSAEFWVNFVL